RIRYGANYETADHDCVTASQIGYLWDAYGHGTMVAGVIGGDPWSRANPASDSDQFYYGGGIAPSAGIFVTKIRQTSDFRDFENNPYTDVLEHAFDAAS